MAGDAGGDFVDAEEFHGGGGKNPLSYPFIVMEQVRRCAQLGSVEFYGGYWSESVSQGGAKSYVPASHESFSEAVRTLQNLLEPYLDDATADAVKDVLASAGQHVDAAARRAGVEPADKDLKVVRAKAHRRVFAILCRALKELNYLEGSGAVEGADDE